MKNQRLLIALSAFTIALVGCGGDSDSIDDDNTPQKLEPSDVKTQEQYKQYIDQQIDEISAIQKFATQPDETNPVVDDSTISGIDNDNNGIRARR